MKVFGKIILIISIFISMSLFSKNDVMAAELEPDEELGETTYTIDNVAVWTEYTSPEGYWSTTIAKGTITLSGYKACMYQKVDSRGSVDTYLLFYNKNGYSSDVSYVKNGTTETGTFNGSEWYDCTWGPHHISNSLNWETYFRTWKSCEWSYLRTNIPIFSSEEQALGYINGTVSISEAENYVDMVNNNTEYDCLDIPVPKNLKVVEESGKYFLTWEQTEEDLDYMTGTKISLDCSEIKYRLEPLKNFMVNTTWIDDVYTLIYGNKFDFEYKFNIIGKALTQKVNITSSMIEFKNWCVNKGWVAYKTDMIYSVFNIMGQADSSGTLIGVRYSPIVKAILHVEWTEDSGLSVEVEYKEVTSSGDYIQDSEYNKFGYGSDLLSTSSGSNFIANIASGFNLLGDNGLIALMSKVFIYIPEEMWVLLGSGLSIFIIVALFKLIF